MKQRILIAEFFQIDQRWPNGQMINLNYGNHTGKKEEHLNEEEK